jgi:hypothetical protein
MFSPSQEIRNLKPKAQEPQTKTQTGLGVFERSSRKKKTIVMFCEGHVSLKEPLKKCKRYSYFAYFSNNLRKIQGDFQTCWTSSVFQRTLRVFGCQSGVKTRFQKSEVTNSEQGASMGFPRSARLEVRAFSKIGTTTYMLKYLV